MIYKARSYAPYRARRRRPVLVNLWADTDPESAAACQCRSGDMPCPRHAPSLYTLWGGRHRLEGVAT